MTPLAHRWYRLRATRRRAELMIYGDIGSQQISAAALLKELSGMGELLTLNVRIHSAGGDVFEALAIHNALRRLPATITASVDGLCASAATVVALAADEVRMAENALWMIHDPWAMVVGNAEALQNHSDTLDTIAEQIVLIYAQKTGAPPEEVRQWMRAETWYTAVEALAVGFVDAIDEPQRIAARLTIPADRFKNIPKGVSPVTKAVPQDPIPPVEPSLTEPPAPGLPALDAVSIARLCNAAHEPHLIPLLLADPRTETEVKARLAQAALVRKVCALARQPELADRLILDGADEATAKLATWNALVDRSEACVVDSTPPGPIPAHLPLEQRCKMMWERDSAIRAEFSTLGIYIAWCKAEETQRAKRYGAKA